MKLKRVKNSKQRLHEKIVEGKTYLEKEVHDVNELMRMKTHLERKRTQFEKDVEVYLKVSDKDDGKIDDYEIVKIEAEDILDDLQHYIDVKKREAEEREIEREAEERKIEREAEEHEKERRYNLEMERIKSEERMTTLKMEEKIAIERLNVE